MIPLVLIHGFMGGSAQWAPQHELSKTYNLIALDLPGFGANNHLPVISKIDAFAEWALGELRARNVHRYHLLGHSMGGMIAQEIARRDHERIQSLVLYGTGPSGILPGRFESIETSKARAKQDGAKITARRIAATWFLARENASEGVSEGVSAYEDCAAIAEMSSIGAINAGLDAMQSWSGLDHLPQIKPSTLVLCGDGDRTYSWEQTELLWTRIARARLAVIPNCAHAVHLEKPALFNALVLDFLSGIDTRRQIEN